MKGLRQRLKGMWKRHGFYLLAGVCLLLIAAAAVYGRGRLFSYAPKVTAAGEGARQASAALTPAPVAPTPAPEPELGWPVSGREIVRAYSAQPVWTESLGLYETHPGVDIGAQAGEAVLCAAEGEVVFAGFDARRGYAVEIAHEGGLVTIYANLSEGLSVRAGDRVRKGQQIGSAGASAPGAKGSAPFVHFEVFRGEAQVALP